ncbi:MAG: FAD-dependent oxidoreductase [Candidatus Saccharibacteria bacterium]
MSDKIRDLVIVGAGPSALAAAIYTTREGIDTILYEKAVVGGIVATIDNVDNYPGFPDGIEGPNLVDQLEKQAKRFGANIEFGDVTSVRDDGEFKILVVDGAEIKAKAVLIATGRSYGNLGAPGELEFFGRGVHYCATCDGAFYHGKRLIVVGGANSAIQEAIYLTRFATHIDLLVRSSIKASEVLKNDLQKLVAAGKITVHLETSVDEIMATNGHVSSVRATKNGESMLIEANGVFIFAGLRPNTKFLDDSDIELNEVGFIKTNSDFQTSISGVFASGDVRNGATMQIASAVGDGVTAAINIREYLHSLDR